MHSFFNEDGLVLVVVCRGVISTQVEVSEGRKQKSSIFNFTFENLEGQDEVRLKTPAFNLLTCTCVGIHPGRVEPASPMAFHR